MKKIKKIFCAIMCLFSVVALGSCDIEKIFEQFQKVFIDINYYIDGEFVDFVTVLKGEKVVVDLEQIYVYETEQTLDKYIESKAVLLGITSDELKNRLGESYTLKDVDRVCEDFRDYDLRLNSLPFSLNKKSVVKIKESVPANIQPVREFSEDDVDVDSLLKIAG